MADLRFNSCILLGSISFCLFIWHFRAFFLFLSGFCVVLATVQS